MTTRETQKRDVNPRIKYRAHRDHRKYSEVLVGVRVYNISWGLNHQLKLLVEMVP